METGQGSELVLRVLTGLASTRPRLKEYLEALPLESRQSLTLRQEGDGYLLGHVRRVPSPDQAVEWVCKTVYYAFR